METQYQKSVYISYAVVGVVVYTILFSAGLYVGGAYDLEARVRNYELVVRAVSVLAGFVVYLSLYRHQRATQFMNEVVTELVRVTWPTPKETANATFIVIVMVVISGMILGLLDYIWTALLKMVL